VSTSSKAPKAVNLDAQHNADARLVDLGRELIQEGLGTEVEIFEGFVAGRATGALSVRGVKATISAINEIGELPSIALTSVQYFEATQAVRLLEGGKNQPLKKVIGVATQGSRKMGKPEFLAKVAEGGSYSTLAKFVENLPAKEKAESSPKVADIDALLAQFVKGFGDLTDITPKDVAVWAEFLAKVKVIGSAVMASHPSTKAKSA
jgi:hypothetical protein